MKTRLWICSVGAAAMMVVLVSALNRAEREQARSRSPFSDYRDDTPGTMRKITPADLPAPYATEAAKNPPKVVARPQDAMPQAMPGYSVSLYAEDVENPRLIRTAPNGDVFVAESRPGRIKVLRGIGSDGRAQTVEVFATNLNRPFGIAFYPPGAKPQYVYVGNTDSIVRFAYRVGDVKARSPAETIVASVPSGGQLPGGGHWTRDIAFSRNGRKMYVGVGSLTNVDDPETNDAEQGRATVLEFNPDGSGRRVYASGVRNAVGLAVHPTTGQLWASVNERDGLGDDLVPDYVTHLEEGRFYGWPWYYIGGNQDPRHKGKHPELQSKVKVPDVLIQPHSASLQMVFYTAAQFPSDHRGIFAAQHGSWNRSVRTGYKVIRVPLKGGAATGEYQDFLTGFVLPDGRVWGRPVGVAVASDGALLVSEDGSDSIWRVSYKR